MNKYAVIYLKFAQGYNPQQTPYPDDLPGAPLKDVVTPVRQTCPGPEGVSKAIQQKPRKGWPNIAQIAQPTN